MKENSLLAKVKQLTSAYVISGDRNLALDSGIAKLAELISANVFVLDSDARIFAFKVISEQFGDDLDELLETGSLVADQKLADLLRKNELKLNEKYSLSSETTAAPIAYASAFPIKVEGLNLATILLLHADEITEEEVSLFVEISALIIGLMIMGKSAEQEEEEKRNKELAVIAFESLSYSEVEAVQEILRKIEGSESIVVASKIADSLGITRSVIVNALRKFESAGVIASRSLGMKGTLIRILNKYILELVDVHATKFRDYL